MKVSLASRLVLSALVALPSAAQCPGETRFACAHGERRAPRLGDPRAIPAPTSGPRMLTSATRHRYLLRHGRCPTALPSAGRSRMQ